MVYPGPYKVRFGGSFELRLKARELYRDGVRLKLRPQPFRVLQILVENAGEVVSREELQKQLWPSDTFVDFEHALNSSVKDLRAVLGDSVQDRVTSRPFPRSATASLRRRKKVAMIPERMSQNRRWKHQR
jgi:hypothetical protein